MILYESYIILVCSLLGLKIYLFNASLKKKDGSSLAIVDDGIISHKRIVNSKNKNNLLYFLYNIDNHYHRCFTAAIFAIGGREDAYD